MKKLLAILGFFILQISALQSQIVINEIMYNPPEAGTDTLEFLELYNAGGSSVNLQGYYFGVGIVHTFSSSLVVPAGGYVVLAVNAQAFTNVFGFPPTQQWTSGSLSNTGEPLSLYSNLGVLVDTVYYRPAAPWPTNPNGNGPSLRLCNPLSDNNDAANWAESTNSTGIFINGREIKATPMAANGSCTAPTAAPVRTIAQMTTENASGVADSLNVRCQLRGIVHSIDFRGGAGVEFTLIDYLHNGIAVFKTTDVDAYAVNMGDSIRVVGTIGQFNGLTQISPDSIYFVSAGNAMRVPIPLTTAFVENHESKLMRLDSVTIATPAQWTGTGTGFNVDLVKGSNTWTMRIDNDSYWYSQPVPTGVLSVIGIISQFDATAPYDSFYQIMPRIASDIVPYVPGAAPSLSFSGPGNNYNENAGTITIPVNIANPSATVATTVQVRAGVTSTATAGVDYSGFTSPMTLTFPAGSSASQNVTITIIDDALIESTETIVLELFNPSSPATLGADSVFTVNIIDNDVPAPAVPKLVINEINYNNPGVDSIEFVEIYNNDTMTVNLAGYQITNGIFFTFPTHSLAPGGYVVVSQDSAWFSRFGVFSYKWNTGTSLNNTGEPIVLKMPNGTIVDSVFYSASAPWPTAANGNGPSLQLCNPNADNNLGSNWSASTNPTGVFMGGIQILATPGAANTACSAGPRLSFTSSGSSYNESAGTLTIPVSILNPSATSATTVQVRVGTSSTATAADYSGFTSPTTLTFPAGSSASQNVSITIVDDALVESNETIVLELFNPSASVTFGADSVFTITILDNDSAPAATPKLVFNEINYNTPGVDSLEFIEIYNNDTMTVDLAGYQISNGVFFTFPTHLLAPGGYVVVSQDSAWFRAAFNMSTYKWTAGNSLNNTGEPLVLRMPNGTLVDSIFYMDSAPWDSGADGFGPSLQLCDPNSDNNNGANWKASTNPTGVFAAGVQILATPGAANTSCSGTPGASYPVYDISQINTLDANFAADSVGVKCELRGVVHCGDFRGGAGYEFYLIQHNNVGIRVFSSVDKSGYAVASGDSLHVRGTIGQLSGVLQITIDSLIAISQGNATVSPMVVASLGENTENKYIQLNNVSIVNSAQWTGTGPGFNVNVSNGTTTFELRIDNDVDLYSQPAPTGTFNVVGMGGQFDSTSPFNSFYQLLPCSSAGITPVAVQDVFAEKAVVLVFPNPASDILNIRSSTEIEMLQISNMLGQKVLSMNNVNNDVLTINCADFAKGVYTISIISNGQLTTKEFIKR